MARNVVYSAVKDEEFYLPMMLESILDHSSIFIVDTGSSDGTVSIIKDFAKKYPGKIILAEETFGSNDFKEGEFRFAKAYRQMDVTNWAMQNAREMCDPDGFVICLDGDEVVNDRFWEILSDCSADALCHATDFPVTPFKVSTHPLDMHQCNGFKLFDPHIRAWRASLNVKWVTRDENSNIHGILQWEKPPKVETVPDNVHFHLHYSFGPKSIYSYICPSEQVTEEAAKILNVPLQEMHNQGYFEEHWPEWFKDGMFIPQKIEENVMWNKHGKFLALIKNPMPEYVVERWRKWGQWIDA